MFNFDINKHSKAMKKSISIASIFCFIIVLFSGKAFCQVDLSSGLVAWYHMDGNANSSVGTGHDLTVNGATLTTDRFGNANSAYHFNGNSTLNGSLNTNGFSGITISAWVNTTQASSYGVILQGSSSFVFYMNRFTAGHYMAAFDANTSNNASYDESTTNVATGKWLFIAASNDGTTTRVYVNGNLEKSYSENLAVSNGQLYIGGTNGGTNMFTGTVDEVRIYNRMLSDEEMAALYVADCPDNINLGLVAWYPMSGNAQNILGTGMDLTVSGATLTTDRFGRPNKAYAFDGNATMITNVNTSSFSGISWSAWINTMQTTKPEVFIQSSYAFVGYVNRFTAGHVMGAFDSNTQDNASTDESVTNVATGDWYFVSSSNDGTTTRVYVNGKLEATYSEILATANSQLKIGGAVGNTTTQFVGSMDEVRIYSRALCDAEMLTLYNQSNTGIETPEKVSAQAFEIYPNPSNGTFLIKNNLDENGIVTVQDINGKVVANMNYIRPEMKFDISSYKPGVYLLKLQTQSTVFTKKIILE
jgi:hypothetical protein